MLGISLLTLATGRMGGSEVYARALTAALARHGSGEYLVALPPDAGDAAGGLPWVDGGAPSTSRRPYAFLRAATSRRALTRVDAVHYPLTVPLPATRRPHAVTLHDVLHLDLPELVPARVRAFRRLAYDAAARRASRVIVPSAFVRDRAVAHLRIDASRIDVVHHGVDHERFHPVRDADQEPFLLYPARAWPHKNHALLFAAFERVRRERTELELVLTGGGHEELVLPGGVRSLGNVPFEELAGLYRRAAAVVFPSLYEGFGSPVLEAMASGCPVAVASGTAAEEVAGGAAVLFDATSVEATAAGIREVLDQGATRVPRGLARARAFTWERAAALHDAVYGELV
jgi:glycosyltransferase involved in cell wall biosynthesis